MIACALLLLASSQTYPPDSRTMFQIGTFENLATARYDGTRPIRDLLDHGDFGLGTFNGLDGEMIVADGQIYHGNAFGDLDKPPLNTDTPFACVVRFRPGLHFALHHLTSEGEVERRIDAAAGSPRKMLAIRIDGQFLDVLTRAFPPQLKPYLPYGALAGREARFDYPTVSGTFVGFRLPKSVGTRNVPGYHFHFVTKDRRHGGHLLEFKIENAVVQIMTVDRIVG